MNPNRNNGKESIRTIALAGNPNVGKSTFFNLLTGMHQHTGNWTGKTVGVAEGEYNKDGVRLRLVDLPGTYSLYAHSEEERVARDYIKSGDADLIAVICDATCLERNLILVLQILELTGRVVVCVNLLDEARRKGIDVELSKLRQSLGVPVIGVCARSGEGIADAVSLFCNEIKELPPKKYEADLAYVAEGIARYSVTQTKKGRNIDVAIDKILTGKFTAFPIMLLLLAILLWLTVEGANYPSQILSRILFYIQDKLLILFDMMGAPWWLSGALVLGVYRTVAWVVSVMLPPMAIFFPLFTILEDLGYLPRVAFNLDRCFKGCKACGKQALTM